MARLNSIFSFVEPGTPDHLSFRIDRWLLGRTKDGRPVLNTEDWAFKDGHFYTNKAPGATMIGIPVYFILFHGERIFGVNPDGFAAAAINAYVINFFVSILPLALAALVMVELLMLFGLTPRGAVFLSILFAVATPLFPYSTQLWGHPAAAAFLVFALYNLARDGARPWFWGGFWLGMAALTEYMAVPVVFVFGVFCLVKNWRRTAWFVAGGFGPMIVFMLYHQACFGSPFSVGNFHVNPAFVEQGKEFGQFSVLSPRVGFELLFGSARGLFFQAPLLLLGLIGAVYAVRGGKHRAFYLAALASIILGLAVNMSFNGWHGGASICARYQIVFIPLWILLMTALPRRRWIYVSTLILGGISFLNMLTVAAVSPLCPPGISNPVYGWTWRQVLSGRFPVFFNLPLRWHGVYPGFAANRDWCAWNLGRIMGLEGLFSLLPLLVAVAFVLFSAWRIKDRQLTDSGLPDDADGNIVGR